MRLPALLLVAGLTLGAAACATTEAPSPAPSSGAPAPVEGYDWHFSGDAASARLAYGVAESDEVRLAMDCEAGAGRLALIANAPDGARPEIHLESGGDTARIRAASEPSIIHDGVFLTADAAADEPVFLRFRRLGWIAMWRAAEREPLAAHPQTLPQIERFFAFCG